jgi:hypothetical protein
MGPLGQMAKLFADTWSRADLVVSEAAGRKSTVSEYDAFTEVFGPFMKAMGAHKDKLVKDYHRSE